ncbi:hypothetical protein COLO4_34665 [Corchorus olitorius]|uniref:Uncharacterized protein n=1 Tax=Corchorus olitorius TaxID=93759 RepID=A0A1R3GK47_9ROSI|nr:hypothetical protein COLO4_34665 [Corchorus olitorius]
MAELEALCSHNPQKGGKVKPLNTFCSAVGTFIAT